MLKCGIRSINDFTTVGTCMKRAYLSESCFYKKDVIMKRYALKYSKKNLV